MFVASNQKFFASAAHLLRVIYHSAPFEKEKAFPVGTILPKGTKSPGGRCPKTVPAGAEIVLWSIFYQRFAVSL